MIKSFFINFIKFFVAILIIGAGVSGYIWLKNTAPKVNVEAVEEKSFTVDTQQIKVKDFKPENISFGSVLSTRQANLTFPMFGEVSEISDDLKSGKFVKKGSVLAKLDNFNQLVALKDLEIQLSLNKSQIDEIQSEINSDEAQLKELEIQFKIRKKQMSRVSNMIKKKASTDSALDEIELAVSNAKSLILSRKQNVNRLSFKIEQLNLSNQRLLISIKKAKKNIEDTILTAPFDGSLSNINIAVGENVSSAKFIGNLSDLNFLEVSFNVPSQVFAKFDKIINKEVIVTWEQGSKEVSNLKGIITRRDAFVNPQDGGGKIFAVLPKPSNNFSLIPPGAFVRVKYPVGELYNVIRLPEEALYEGNAVFVIVDGRSQKRSVSIAYKEPGYVYIQGNLRENEVAIISRLAGIGEGMKLETRK
mgnify:CR=1 FL=1